MSIYESFLQDVSLCKDDFRVYDIGNNIMLTSREVFVASFLLEKFVPTLKTILHDANPELFNRWQGNCCRQVAMMVTLVLQEALPEYHWQPYEGTFSDRFGTYDHAFIIGSFEKKKLLVDLSRKIYPSLFMPITKDIYPNFGMYADMTMVSHKIMPFLIYMSSNEYYTTLPGIELFKKVVKECRSTSFDLDLRIRQGLYPLIKRVISVEEAIRNEQCV